MFGSAQVDARFTVPASGQVLIVEDSPVYRKLICDGLQRWGFSTRVACSGSEAWNLLQQSDSPNLMLLDWILPDVEGVDLCRRIRKARLAGTYVYIILLTSKEGRNNMLDAMRAGVDDYLVKPFDEEELRARLLVGRRILALQTDLVAARESMRHAATHDFLTGLKNRKEIMQLLQNEVARAQPSHFPRQLLHSPTFDLLLHRVKVPLHPVRCGPGSNQGED